MSASKRYCCSILILLVVSSSASFSLAAQFSPSTEVQKNIAILQESKNCPQCNLSGANLNRMDLSGANLEGADLSRAKLFLTNLSGANLQDADLREAKFGGADLAGADLRGADLTGVSLSGAYMEGILLDGEMITTTPYAENNISNIEEKVYVEDTVNAKALPNNDEMNISSRRDFEETPPAVVVNDNTQPTNEQPTTKTAVENSAKEDEGEKAVLPQQSAVAPEAKAPPVIERVQLEEDIQPEILHPDATKKQLSGSNSLENSVQETDSTQELETVDQAIISNEESLNSDELSTSDDKDSVVLSKKEGTEDNLAGKENKSEAESVELVTEPIAVSINEMTKDDTVIEEIDAEAPVVSLQPDILEKKTEAKEIITEKTGIVASLLNVFSSPEPSSEVMKNVAVLLDTNRCYGCDLKGVNLSGEDLEDADLEGADLSNAVLSKVDFEGANLKGANLTGADLTGADLSEADMYRASLQGANLTNAKLEDTLLDDVDLSGVTGYQKEMMLMEKN